MRQFWNEADTAPLYALWLIIQVLIGFHLLYPLLLLIFSKLYKTLFMRYFHSTAEHRNERQTDHAIIITAYGQADQITDAVKSALELNHPSFRVYVVADNCDVSGLFFNDKRISLLIPPDVIANNIGSHLFAIKNFQRSHTHLTILDSDNQIDREYLNETDKKLFAGFKAVQGVRKAKNLNTSYARLDAARDLYYHYYDGKILFDSGSSATLAGSGMTFETHTYLSVSKEIQIRGAGFDKVVQFHLLKKGLRIAFCQAAFVFDEKSSQADQLVKQRARWINTWFRYFGFGFHLVYLGIRKMSVNQFLFGMTLLRPPLFIFLLLSVLCMTLNLWFSTFLSIIWLAGLVIFVLSFFIALLRSGAEPNIYRALINIPAFMFQQLRSLAKSRKANQMSVATEHYTTARNSISNDSVTN